MKKFGVLLMLLVTATLAGAQQGFDFRATASFVSDPAGNMAVLPTTAYPTVANGLTFGWVNPALTQGRDRCTAVDPRLAGINFASNGAPATFYVDLPAPGTYKLTLAMGDEGWQECWAGCQIQVFDGNKLIGTVANGIISGGYFYDAQGTAWSAQAWPNSNAVLPVTLTGTRLTMVVGTQQATGDFTTIAFLGIEAVVKPNFSLASTFTVKQGKQISFPVTLSTANGFNAAIALSAINVPNGVTVTFDQQIMLAPGSGSTTMTISAASNAPPGFYPVIMLGDGGGLEQTALVAVTVTQ
jgi:hypothetical protein